MDQKQHDAHLLRMAESRCRDRHPEIFNTQVCIGPGGDGQVAACDECIKATRRELHKKSLKAHGQELSPEESARVLQELGIDDNAATRDTLSDKES